MRSEQWLAVQYSRCARLILCCVSHCLKHYHTETENIAVQQGHTKVLCNIMIILNLPNPWLFCRYQIEGMEDQDVMKREEEANFPHIESDTEYNFQWWWPFFCILM
jgi:hypothetical protein